jgi:hypothetical protein
MPLLRSALVCRLALRLIQQVARLQSSEIKGIKTQAGRDNIPRSAGDPGYLPEGNSSL